MKSLVAVAVASALAALGCAVDAHSDRATLAEFGVLGQKYGLSIARIYGNQFTVVRLDGTLEERKIGTRRYFYGAAVHPSGTWFAGPTDEGVVAQTFEGEDRWTIPDLRGVTRITWSHDGEWLAAESQAAPHAAPRLQVVEVATRAITPVADAAKHPTWGPRGQLAFEKDGTLHVFDVRSRQVTALAPGTDPSWSPTGASIAFRDPQGDFRLLDVTGRTSGDVWLRGQDIASPIRWSPNGELLLFIRRGSGALIDLGLDCVEPKRIVIRLASGGNEAVVHQVCKSSPLTFEWLPERSVPGRVG